MNNTHPKRNDDERLIELAKARAAVLRREAIDDFWRGVGSVARRMLHGVARQCQGLMRLIRREAPTLQAGAAVPSPSASTAARPLPAPPSPSRRGL